MQQETKDLLTIKKFTVLSEQELDRIETLVQNLLKITKLDAGTIMIEKTMENVSEMMDCIERHFSYGGKIEEKKIYLSGNDTLTLLCDWNWLIGVQPTFPTKPTLRWKVGKKQFNYPL